MFYNEDISGQNFYTGMMYALLTLRKPATGNTALRIFRSLTAEKQVQIKYGARCKQLNYYRILGSDGGDYQEYYHLGYNAM
jgi:hypothetical protein